MAVLLNADFLSLSPINNRNNMTLLNESTTMQYFKSHEFLINWVNSFESPFCLLASDARDFQSGVVLCEVIHEIYFQNNNLLLQQQIQRNDTIQRNQLINFNIALDILKQQGLKLPQQVQQANANQICQNLELVFLILETLYKKTQGSQSTTMLSYREKVMEIPVEKSFDVVPRQKKIRAKKPPLPRQSKQSKQDIFIQDQAQTIKRGRMAQQQVHKDSQYIQNSDNQVFELISSIDENITSRQYSAPQREAPSQPQKQHGSLSPQSIRRLAMERFSPKLFDDKPEQKDNSSLPPLPKKERRKRKKSPQKSAREVQNEQVFEVADQRKAFSQIDEKENGEVVMVSPVRKVQTPRKQELVQTSARHQQTIKKLINDIDNIENQIHQERQSARIISKSIKKQKKENKSSKQKRDRPYTSQSFRRTYQNYNQKDIQIDQVSQKSKEKVLKWLKSICLIKEGVSSLGKKLHKICKNGVIFSDIINRVEGRNQNIIKGIHRNAKKSSYINSNYARVFNYLRKLEKLNPRYIYAEEYLKQGNHNVFWGFLDDL